MRWALEAAPAGEGSPRLSGPAAPRGPPQGAPRGLTTAPARGTQASWQNHPPTRRLLPLPRALTRNGPWLQDAAFPAGGGWRGRETHDDDQACVSADPATRSRWQTAGSPPPTLHPQLDLGPVSSPMGQLLIGKRSLENEPVPPGRPGHGSATSPQTASGLSFPAACPGPRLPGPRLSP